MKKFLRKHYSNILFAILLALLIIPQTRLPIQVFVLRILSSSPSESKSGTSIPLTDYSWNLLSIDHQSVNFSRSRGKVVLVNHWATWCPPCLAEMPEMQRLYDRYGKQVDFYFVSTESIPTLEQFLQKKNYDLPVYQEQSSTPGLISTQTLPTTFVLSKSGRIVMQHTGAADWDSKTVHELLDRLLKEE